MASPLSYDAYRAQQRFPALDGLRAIAILGVLLHHTRGAPFWRFNGYRGVWIFFVLSGFLITTLALRQESQLGRLDLGAFAIRRVFRIMPMYYLTLAAYCVAVCCFALEPNGQLLREHLGAFMLYSSEFPIFRSGFRIPFGQSWSLGIEEKFYLVWPLVGFFLLTGSRHRIPVTIGLIAMTATLTAASGIWAQMWGSYTDILIGCLLAQLLHERATYDKLIFLGRSQVTWALSLALALATLRSAAGGHIAECLYAALVATVLIGLVTCERGPSRSLRAPWLMQLGAWSYTVYLTHTFCFDVTGRLMPAGRVGDLLTLPATVLLDIPLVWFLHHYFERPMIELGRKLSSVSARAPAIAVASVPPDRRASPRARRSRTA
jgi:peptidoglycan/LPS O-acetylase OafA/YrhL